MQTCEVRVDGCRGNARGVASKQTPQGETTEARKDPSQRKGVIQTEGVRPTKPYACGDCGYSTDRKNNLQRHRATMHDRCDRALECCGLAFINKSELRQHVTEQHGAGAGYACRQCGRRFGRRALMRRHAAVHDPDSDASGHTTMNGERRRPAASSPALCRRYACNECEYTTEHKSNLDRHLRRHSGRPWSTADDLTVLGGGGISRDPPVKSGNSEDSQSIALSAVTQREFSEPWMNCRCRVCLATSRYRRQFPLPSSLLSSLPAASPFVFGPGQMNLLSALRLGDAARRLYKPLPVDVTSTSLAALRQLWPLHVDSRDPSIEPGDNWDSQADDLSMTKKATGQPREVETVRLEALERTPASSSSTMMDDTRDEAASSPTSGEGVDGQGRGRRRPRLLPLLHTCRSCSLTFVTQLDLQFHSDLFHHSDLDVRPICWRTDRQNVHTS